MALQHGGEQERAASLECHLVHVNRDFEASAERNRASCRQPADDALHVHGLDALDLPSRAHIGRRRIELEQIPQGRRALLWSCVDEREVVERQMADRAPRDGAIRDGRIRPARAADRPHAQDRRRDVQRKVALAQSGRHVQHQLAVGTQRLERELPQVRGVRRLIGVDERQEDFTADVARSGSSAPLIRWNDARFPARREIGRLVVVEIGAVGCIERKKALLAVVSRAVTDNVRDLVDLKIQRPGSIRDDVELERRVAHVNPIEACFLEEIHGRRAEHLQVRPVDDAFERGVAAAEQNHELDFVPRDPAQARKQSGQLEESVALREAEVFLQQTVSLEGSYARRQQRFVVGEANRSNGRRRQQRHV